MLKRDPLSQAAINTLGPSLAFSAQPCSHAIQVELCFRKPDSNYAIFQVD